jgi:hypothetical protein
MGTVVSPWAAASCGRHASTPAHPSLYSFDGRSWTEHAPEVAPGFVFATATTVYAYGLNSSYLHGGDILSHPR